jgi:GH15 family glucan-1,4-alpha-glucosidase
LVDLGIKSIAIIRENQEGNGAIIACPSFPTYRYSWLRDGSFAAWAMLREGHADSCRSFLRWVGGVICAQEKEIRELSLRPAGNVGTERWLPARYAADGGAMDDEWPNHQIDGYGAWLWCLAEYRRASGDESLCRELAPSVELTVEYLARTWQEPCFDCWEENGTRVHSSTLACVYGGLSALRAFHASPTAESVASRVRAFLLHNTVDGRFRKHDGTDSVDASLLWLSLPFGVVEPDHPLMQETVRHIESRLLFRGGVTRYPEDTYYGGGRWLILSCWLGWHYARTGRTAEARIMLAWVAAQADAEGNLPEQVSTDVIDPTMIEPWVKRWGPVARPLVWSHAMYLVLKRELATAELSSAKLHREES